MDDPALDEPTLNEAVLPRWAEGLAADLGVDMTLDVDAVLDLAADAAHGIMRPAAPLTTYLVGVAIGQVRGDPDKVGEVLERVRAAIAGWQDTP